MSVICLLMAFLSGCAKAPLVVSADTSCERFRHISASSAQIAAMKGDWGDWESLAIQIAQHNVEFEKACLKPVAGP